MRWFKAKEPEVGDTRLDRFFLIFPITINRETRWLEMATIEYTWVMTSGMKQEIMVRWVD